MTPDEWAENEIKKQLDHFSPAAIKRMVVALMEAYAKKTGKPLDVGSL